MARTIVKNGVLKNFDDREATIQMFKDHISHVKSVVPPNQLLVLYPGDGWGPLCEFLGLDIPAGIPYPHSNRAPNFHKRMFALRDILAQPMPSEKMPNGTLAQMGVDFGETVTV